MTKIIYLDYAATTPVAPSVVEAMRLYLTLDGTFGNPASTHRYGWEAEQAVQEATQQFAACINAHPDEIIWTSGATESNNLALKGLFEGLGRKATIITSPFEHSSVLEVCRYLEHAEAPRHCAAVFFKPSLRGPEGRSNPLLEWIASRYALRARGRNDGLIFSFIDVNNETGLINDIRAIAQQAHEQKAIFHVDAAQALGKLPIDVKALDVDLMSFSGHKINGPKGIGALYVRRSVKSLLKPQMHGGGQQQGLRSGTLAPHLIVGMAEAAVLNTSDLPQESKRQTALREQLWEGLKDLPGIMRHGDPLDIAPHILCVSFEGISAQQIVESLPNLAISSGSACHSTSLIGNPVLKSMGFSEARARNSLRFSLGRFTTTAEIHAVVEQIKQLNLDNQDLWQLR